MINKIIIGITSFLMLFGGINHIIKPEFYNGFIPDFLPKLAVNYFSAIVELIIGGLILYPKTRKQGFLAFIALMFAFYPIHIWDLLKETPAIGSHQGRSYKAFCSGDFYWDCV